MKPNKYINVPGEGLYPPITNDDQVLELQTELRKRKYHLIANIISAYNRLIGMSSDRREHICKTIQQEYFDD